MFTPVELGALSVELGVLSVELGVLSVGDFPTSCLAQVSLLTLQNT